MGNNLGIREQGGLMFLHADDINNVPKVEGQFVMYNYTLHYLNMTKDSEILFLSRGIECYFLLKSEISLKEKGKN